MPMIHVCRHNVQESCEVIDCVNLAMIWNSDYHAHTPVDLSTLHCVKSILWCLSFCVPCLWQKFVVHYEWSYKDYFLDKNLFGEPWLYKMMIIVITSYIQNGRLIEFLLISIFYANLFSPCRKYFLFLIIVLFLC